MTHPVIAEVTNRIATRSAEQRGAYLERMAAAAENGPARGRLACANLAHGFAASDTRDKSALRGMVKPNIAIVSSYNDMLSAHKPFESYPTRLKQAVREAGGIVQFAGGVPAMCDGITQGRNDMKFFPAEAAGGAPYLRAIHSPVPSAGFCPTGGITPTNIAEYLKTPNVGCVGGSWLTPADAVDRRDWAHISDLARKASSQ